MSNSKKIKYSIAAISFCAFVSIFYPFIYGFLSANKFPEKNKTSLNNIPVTAIKCLVTKVYDGDTVTLNCPEQVKLRLACIDTPEMKQGNWGRISRDILRGMIKNPVFINVINKDRYGRSVGYIYSNNINLNLEMIRLGAAAVYKQYCKDKDFYNAMLLPKDKNIGIWSESGLHQTPWIYRKK